MKLLITGGAGFIGTNFVHYWVKYRPHDTVVVLDKLTYAGHEENLAPVREQIEFIKGDICDAAVVNKTMAGADIVVHFAAETHVDRSIAGPAIFLTTNVIGTQVLLDAALKAGVKKFHHISTDEVFGDIPLDSKEKFNEASLYKPSSPYAASKAASDHLVNSYHRTYGLHTTITNCSNNFGPYMHPEKFIPRAITNVLEGQSIPLYKPGNQVRDWLHVEDHCRAIEAVLEKGQPGATYCVGGMTEQVSNEEVAKKILDIMGAPADWLEHVTDRPGHDVKYVVDWNKIKNELGWAPEHNFDDWLAETVKWYEANKPWWEPLKRESEAFYQSIKKS
jgi:dTDP-glucose 4,6-dehydratase